MVKIQYKNLTLDLSPWAIAILAGLLVSLLQEMF